MRLPLPYITQAALLLHPDDVRKHISVRNRLDIEDKETEVICDGLFPNLTDKEMQEQLEDILLSE